MTRLNSVTFRTANGIIVDNVNVDNVDVDTLVCVCPAVGIHTMAPSTRGKPSTSKKRSQGASKAKEAPAKKKARKEPRKEPRMPKLPTQATKEEDRKPAAQEVGKKRPPNFVEDEDILLCRAVVNISQDSATKTDQTIDEYWQRILGVFNELKKKDSNTKDLPERTPSALKNRFDGHIKPGVNKFNRFYKSVKEVEKSGYQEHDYITEAGENYLKAEGKPFPWSKCAPILWKCPKYHPIVCNLVGDPEDDEVKANVVSQLMGEGKERPIGSKAAKAGKKNKLDAASVASLESGKVANIQAMSESSRWMATTMAHQAQTIKHQTSFTALMEEAKFFREMGEMDESRRLVQEARTHRIAIQVQPDVDPQQKQGVAVSVRPMSAITVPDETTKASTKDSTKEDEDEDEVEVVEDNEAVEDNEDDEGESATKEDGEGEQNSLVAKVLKDLESGPLKFVIDDPFCSHEESEDVDTDEAMDQASTEEEQTRLRAKKKAAV